MDAKELQQELLGILRKKFGNLNVEKEWDPAKGSQDDYHRQLYCPRVDLAVSPFNKIHNSQERENILKAVRENQDFIEKLKEVSYHINFKESENPRCFLAIEIEASGSRKHHLGDITNASILGAVGIIITLDKEGSSTIYNGFKRTRDYLKFATDNNKIESTLANNLLIIRSEDFIRILKEELEEQS